MADVTPEKRIVHYRLDATVQKYIPEWEGSGIDEFTTYADKTTNRSTTHIFSRGQSAAKTGAAMMLGASQPDSAVSMEFRREGDDLLFLSHDPKLNAENNYVFSNQFAPGAAKALERLEIHYQDKDGHLQKQNFDLSADAEKTLEQMNSIIKNAAIRHDTQPDFSRSKVHAREPGETVEAGQLQIKPQFRAKCSLTAMADNNAGVLVVDLQDFKKSDLNIYTAPNGVEAYGNHPATLRVVIENTAENARFIIESPRQFGGAGALQQVTFYTRDGEFSLPAESLHDKNMFAAALDESLKKAGYNEPPSIAISGQPAREIRR